MLNQLEPTGLVDSFMQYPPIDFNACYVQDLPCFEALFNLLTTLDQDLKCKLYKIPGLNQLAKRFCSPRTLFAGTTVSEYLLYPYSANPATVLDSLFEKAKASRASLIILKDIPEQNDLLESTQTTMQALRTECIKREFVIVTGQALAYVPIDFASIEEFMTRFSSSRRKDLRRKLKKSSQVKVVQLATGDSEFYQPEFLDRLYQLYLAVFEQSEIHFDKLSAEFFKKVFQDSSLQGIVFLYQHGARIIAFNLCFVHNNNLVDKYIGLEYPIARDLNIYFISWFSNLDYALKHNLKNYIAGWTDPQVKASLGASFALTKHAVYFRSPILRAVLKPFKRFFEGEAQEVMQIGK